MSIPINRNYGKLDKITNRIEYAPKTLKVDGAIVMNPSKALYLKFGWKEIIENPPKTERGYHYVEKEWYETGDSIVRKYEIVKDEPIKKNRIFSKMKCVAILMKLGYWEQVRDWINTNGLTDLYLAAQDFKEDNEYFIQGKSALQQLLGLKEWEIEKILRQCVAD